MRQDKKFVILNMSDDNNKGDLAILESIVQILKRKSSDITVINVDFDEDGVAKMKWVKRLGVTHLSALIPGFQSQHGLKKPVFFIFNLFLSISLMGLIYLLQESIKIILYLLPKRYENTVKAIIDADAVFVKGGSFLYDYGGIKNGIFFFRMVYSILISIFLKKDLYFLGVSIGPLKSRLSRWLMRICLSHSKKVIIREYISYEYINKYMKGLKNLYVLPDMAFFGSYNERTNVENFFKNENVPFFKTKLRIGMTARTWHFPQAGEKGKYIYKNYVESIIIVCKSILEKYNSVIYFMPHNFKDIPLEEAITKQIGSGAYVLKGDYSVEELKSIYSSLDFMVGTRLHSCILSLSVGTPALHIAYMKHKGIGIYSLFSIEGFAIDGLELKPKNLMIGFEQMIKEKKKIILKINRRLKKERKTIEDKILYEI